MRRPIWFAISLLRLDCIFWHRAGQLGPGHTVLCAKRVVDGDPFAVLLSYDFMTDCEPRLTADLENSIIKSDKSNLSVSFGKEIQLAEATSKFARHELIEIVRPKARHFDCHDVHSHFSA